MDIETNHFVSLYDAIKYYKSHTVKQSEAYRMVHEKSEKGEIYIGAPDIEEGEYTYIDNEGRYFIGKK